MKFRYFISIIGVIFFSGCMKPKLKEPINVNNKEDKFTYLYPYKGNNKEVVPFQQKNYSINKSKIVFVGEPIVRIENYKKELTKLICSNCCKANDNFQLTQSYSISENSIYKIKGIDKQNKNIFYLKIDDNYNIYFLKIDKNCNLIDNDKIYDPWGNVSKIIKNQLPTKKTFTLMEKNDGEIVKERIIYDDSFKYELIYNGKSGNNIKVSYREFINDMARPAFNQELTYNFKESNIIRYKNFRIKILKADNEKIEYIVLED